MPENKNHPVHQEETDAIPSQNSNLNLLDKLTHLGLGEFLLQFGGQILIGAALVAVIWTLALFYKNTAPQTKASAAQDGSGSAAAAATQSHLPTPDASQPVEDIQPSLGGIVRVSNPHTIIPTRPRQEVVKYTVQEGDTIFGIAEKFGLKPQTVLWANYYILKDDPHNLRPGQELNILPIDGTYYEWQEGDGLNGVASFFGVTPDAIVNYPGNHLDAETVGDYAHPNIAAGTWLVVPGGEREFVSWSAPIGVTRDNPAVARVLGPGSCGSIQGGAVGFGTFIWPANRHYLSGYDYSPETNHRGIDIAGALGEPLYAVDAGVIVYAGWNNWGYGYMVMIDHGNGWQSLYAHMSDIYVVCGQSVGQGEVIGAIGSTGNSSGPHLHFELMHTQYGKVNPWDFLPPP